MIKRTKTLVTGTLTAVLAAAGVLTGAVGTASAESLNRQTVYLYYPSDPLEGDRCVTRRIDLISGRYRWRTYYRPAVEEVPTWHAPRYIDLAAGRYTWRDCLRPAHVPWGTIRGYAHWSTLATGPGPASIANYMQAHRGKGTYNFGSGLLRVGKFGG